MKTISNSDYHLAKRLLCHLYQRKGNTLREHNASRMAGRLLHKWDKNEKK